MSEVRRLIQWGVVLTILTLVAIVSGAFLLYQQGFQAEREALEDTLATQAALIEAVAAFDRVTSPGWDEAETRDFARGPLGATLSQIEAAFAASPGLGETGELVLGRQVDGRIEIFLHQRAKPDEPLVSIPSENGAAEPMRRALAGRSGTVIAEDFLHKTVLSAYQPLEGLGWGLVAKKDLAEIRAPFTRSAVIAALIGGVLVLIGGLLFRRATDPLINRLRRSEARYAQLLEQAAEAVIVLDVDDHVLIANTRAAEIFGVSSQVATGRNVHDFLPADLSRRIKEAKTSRESGQAGEYEYTLHRGDRDLRLRISASPLIGPGGEYEGRMALAADITPEYRQRQTRERERRLLRTVLDTLPVGVWVLDAQGQFVLHNAAGNRIWGVEDWSQMDIAERLEGFQGWDLETGHLLVGDEWGAGRALRGEVAELEAIEIAAFDGQRRVILQSAAPLRDKEGAVTGAVVMAQDITEQRGAEEALYRATREDLLTGLDNELAFREALADRLQRIERGRRSMALALVDLRGFSRLNDALGRKAGDAILREEADRLRGVVRPGDLVAHLGADTFAVLFADVAREEHLPWVIDKLEKALDPPFTPGEGQSIVVPHYIGVARAPMDARDVEPLLAHAHTALDAAKADPVSNLRYYASEYGHRAMRQLSLEGALRRALARDALELYFQPQIDLADGRLRSVETLLRWDDPELGWISPAEFIPLAERVGLIAAIDDWVLEHALAIQAEWRRTHRSTWITALNLSGARIADRGLPKKVAAVLERARSSPAYLEIEVTETAAMQGSEVEQRNLAALREMGVSVAVDDFGTGYSSMAQLARMPVDVLKIDRSFVNSLGHDEIAIHVVRTILSLAHSMDLAVIAEGIETREQLAFLSREGCKFGQGFLLARPMPAEEMRKNLERENWLPADEEP